MKYKLLYVIASLLILAAGCPKEDPDLVSPPSFKDSVNVRLVNLTTESIEMIMDSEINSGEVPFLNISAAVNPPSDSAVISINQNGNQLFEDTSYYQFSRGLNFAFIALPKPNSDTREFDTLVSFTDLGDLNDDQINATVKVLNAIPDTNQTISIQVGCPGGDNFASFLSYGQLAFDKPLRAGEEITLSMVKTVEGQNQTIGTYAYTFDQGFEYTLIPTINENGDEDLFVLDEKRLYLDEAEEIPNTLLEPLDLVEEQFTNIRLLNLLDEPVNIVQNGTTLFSGVDAKYLSDFIEIPACVSTTSETFTINSNTFEHYFSPVVNERYTLIAYRSLFSGEDTLRFIEPALINEFRNNRAALKTINLQDTTESLTVSLGSNTTRRDSTYEENGETKKTQILETTSGFTFAARLNYGNQTSDVLNAAGIKPINIFNSAQPASYISSFVKELIANTDYTLIAYKDGQDNKFFVMEESTTSGPIQPETEGVLTSFVNAFYGAESVDLTVDNILESATLFPENSLTTILPEGTNTLIYNGNSYQINSTIGQRNLVIFEGQDLRVEDIKSFPNIEDQGSFFIRTIHLAYDLAPVRFRLVAGPESPNLYGGNSLAYGELFSYENVALDADMSLQIIDPNIPDDSETSNVIFEQSNLPVTRGKNYTFIVVGTEGNYNILIQQEF